MEKAERVIERMKVGGVEPNQVTYGTLIKGYAEQGDIDNIDLVYTLLQPPPYFHTVFFFTYVFFSKC